MFAAITEMLYPDTQEIKKGLTVLSTCKPLSLLVAQETMQWKGIKVGTSK